MKSGISFVLLFVVLWLVKKTHAIFSANQSDANPKPITTFFFFFFFLITNTILTIQYETPLTLITMLIYITLLTVTNNYTTYSIQLY